MLDTQCEGYALQVSRIYKEEIDKFKRGKLKEKLGER